MDVIAHSALACFSAVLLGAPSLAQGGPPLFPGASYVPGGSGGAPTWIALGDLDGDGFLDAAVTDGILQTVSILHGDGYGGFSLLHSYAVGTAPSSVALADLDGDGHLDAVVVDVNASSSLTEVSVLLGDGSGGLLSPTGFSVAFGSPSPVVLGDLDHDGRLDAVLGVTWLNHGSIEVLRGDGTGGFLAPMSRDAPAGFVALGDMNEDGNLDVVASAANSPAAVLLGDGTGGLLAPTNLSSSSSVPTLALGDLNADGHLDVVTADGDASRMWILLGDGAGGAAPGVQHTIGGTPTAVAIGDLDGDGHLDLFAASGAGSSVSILEGDGAGNVGPATTLGVGGCQTVALALADLNGDGALDAAMPTDSNTDTVLVLLGTGSLSFGVPRIFPTVEEDPTGVALGDLNGDGTADAVATSYHTRIFVRLADGAGGLLAETPYTVDGYPTSVALGDLNGDAHLDAVVTASNLDGSVGNLRVCLGNGAGALSPQGTFPVRWDPRCVALGDLDGDGRLDAVAANYLSDDVSVLLGDGAGGFLPQTSYPVGGGPTGVALGDLNGDGRLDVVTANQRVNTITVRLGNGMGGLLPAATFPAGQAPTAVACGDLNGDGKSDVVVAEKSGNFSVRIADGSGGLLAPTLYAAGNLPVAVALADLDGDGALDAIAANLGSSNVSVRPGDGSGGFLPQTLYAVGKSPTGVAVGHVDGDGRLDLATSGKSFRDVSVLQSRSPSLPMVAFCFPGVAGVHACPCGNPPSSTGRGCDNFGTGTGGASLSASGSASLAGDNLVLTATDLNATALTVFVQSKNALAGGVVFGAGVRCVEGGLKRLYSGSASGGTLVQPLAGGPRVSARSAALGDAIASGESRYYMAYYRDPNAAAPCGSSAATFNGTPAGAVTWHP